MTSTPTLASSSNVTVCRREHSASPQTLRVALDMEWFLPRTGSRAGAVPGMIPDSRANTTSQIFPCQAGTFRV